MAISWPVLSLSSGELFEGHPLCGSADSQFVEKMTANCVSNLSTFAHIAMMKGRPIVLTLRVVEAQYQND